MNPPNHNHLYSSSSASTDGGGDSSQKERALFLPSRVFPYEHHQLHPGDHRNPAFPHPHRPPLPPAGVQWDNKKSVLDWISSLAQTAEQRRASGGAICVANVRLSDIQKDHQQHCRTVAQQQTAFRPHNDDTSSAGHGSAMTFPAPPCGAAPRYWDLSYVAHADPYADRTTHHPAEGRYLSHLRYLAAQYESFLYYYCSPGAGSSGDGNTQQQHWADYQTVQHRLYFLFGRIFGQFPPGTVPMMNGELRNALDGLYQETIEQMQKLLDQASSIAGGGGGGGTGGPNEHAHAGVDGLQRPTVISPSPTENTHHSLSPTRSVVTSSDAASTVSATTTASSTTSTVLPKKDMARYLTDWLRENWTNPYPDDQGVAEMAEACGTTSTVISNWLINARTRKWRPAIVKATELNRPADLLLEDSIQIFDGKPVRPLEECYSSFDDDDDGRDEPSSGHGAGFSKKRARDF